MILINWIGLIWNFNNHTHGNHSEGGTEIACGKMPTLFVVGLMYYYAQLT